MLTILVVIKIQKTDLCIHTPTVHKENIPLLLLFKIEKAPATNTPSSQCFWGIKSKDLLIFQKYRSVFLGISMRSLFSSVAKEIKSDF